MVLNSYFSLYYTKNSVHIYKLIYQIIINNITYTLKDILKLFRFGVKQCIHELVRIKFLQIIDGLTDSDILDRH